jgi:hypothetical protein
VQSPHRFFRVHHILKLETVRFRYSSLEGIARVEEYLIYFEPMATFSSCTPRSDRGRKSLLSKSVR